MRSENILFLGKGFFDIKMFLIGGNNEKTTN